MLPVALFAMSGTAGAQETVSVAVGDIWFCDASFQDGVCDTVIDVGDTVVWDFSGTELPHTTTECGASCDTPASSPAWDSGAIAGGGETFEFTFTEPGTYLYRCAIHPFTQRGQIIVQGAPTTATVTPPPSPTASEETPPPATAAPTTISPATPPPATATPTTVMPDNGTSPTPTPATTATVGSPITGAGPQAGSFGAWWAPAMLAAAGGALVAMGGGWHARRRQLQVGSRDDG